MSFEWGILTGLNVLYSTVVIGGILWYKLHRMRLDIHEEYEELRKLVPTAPVGELLVKDDLALIHTAIREQNIRLSEIESRLDRLGDGGPK